MVCSNSFSFFYPNMPIFMTDQNDTYVSHYPNATHHTTSDTHMSFIEINTKKQFKLHIHTTVPSAECKTAYQKPSHAR